MPYINVNDAYILDNTGKQVDDAVDYALANGNRNLLDNPFFTVNQRGVSGTLTGNYGYCFDRWKLAGGGSSSSMTIGSDGRTITLNGTSQYTQLRQNLEPILCNSLMRRTVTLSCLFSDGNIFAATFTPTSEAQYTKYMANNRSYLCLDLRTSQRCAFVLINGESRTIKAMKLELGSYSTLANDVPPNYGEELRKCKYYFERVKTEGNTLSLGIGYNDGYNTMYGVMKIEPKRVTPSLSGSSLLIGTTSLNTTSSSKSIYSFGSDGTAVIQIVATNAFSTNQPYRFGLPSNGYLDFSADL